jgi:hypothetical protein
MVTQMHLLTFIAIDNNMYEKEEEDEDNQSQVQIADYLLIIEY